MFTHNLKYSLKILFKNKTLIFWTFAFPIILGVFFYLAFSNIEKTETFSSIPIAVIENDTWNNSLTYKETIKVLSDKNNEDRIFKTTYIKTEKEGQKLLNEDNIVGYLIIDDTTKIIIKKNGTSETIFKQVIDEIQEKEKTIENLVQIEISKNKEENIEMIYNQVITKVMNLSIKENIKDVSSSKLSYVVIEYYTLIAMSCLYSGTLAMCMVNKCLANMSSNGKRVSASSISKGKLILGSLISSYIAAIIGLALLLIFTTLILKVDFGSHFALIILLSLVGTLSGLSLGTFTSVIFKSNENTKIGIIIAITMLGCFLSGMMGITMKYIIDKNVPIINKINPASMITDGFYSLYYYEGLERYIFNIISLLIFSFILLFISYLNLRRQSYDSI